MNKFRVSVFLVLTILAIMATGSRARAQITSLAQVKGANAEADLKLSIAKNDLRFIAVNGVAAGMVPGTDQYGLDRPFIEAQGTRTLRGTSDYKDIRLNELAWEYARTYNRLLLYHLRTKQP
jgi:hypothetical protein